MSKPCPVGCTCGKHAGRDCLPGCTCKKHTKRTIEQREATSKYSQQAWAEGRYQGKESTKDCPPECTCGKHTAQHSNPTVEACAAVLESVGYRREYWVRTGPNPLEGYRLDFALPSHKFNFELDGPYHQSEFDAVRDSKLRAMGWKIVRIQHD